MAPMRKPRNSLAAFQILEARDLNHAVQLVSQQPGFGYGLGPIEIRPIVDLSEMIKVSGSPEAEGVLRQLSSNEERHILI